MSFNLTIDNGRRSGNDRREPLYLVFTPERRSGKDRRDALDKHENQTKFVKESKDRYWRWIP